MAICQWRNGGNDTLILYKKRFSFFGYTFWKKIEVFSYRQYTVEQSIAEHVDKIKSLTRELESLKHKENAVKASISRSKQDDPNHSDPEEMPIPKDSSKFRSKRGRVDEKTWLPFVQLVRRVHGSSIPNSAEMRDAKVDSSTGVDRVGIIDQPIGAPVSGNNNRKNRGGGNQNNQQSNNR